MKTLIDGRGRIELPDVVQLKLGVKPGDELALDEENGRWFIELAHSGDTLCEPRWPADEVASPSKAAPADTDPDEMNWEELDYEPVKLKHAAIVAIQVEQRGQLKPMVHLLDDE